ncbi:hypothetical protein CHS0354_024998 [Potamilus streckersoni]|uniref:Uncharacterized protein n=1 Tax=Potamilus streckersoni TaxID=2493646 RepID=A0AAE0W182_9BIVA|nr:hypothetical protein CHS0354_024998 [Potamilus streckersoni]
MTTPTILMMMFMTPMDTPDEMRAAVEDEESVKKRIFGNLRRALHNSNVEESDLDKNKRATTVYGVELLVAVDPPVWQKQVTHVFFFAFRWSHRLLFSGKSKPKET